MDTHTYRAMSGIHLLCLLFGLAVKCAQAGDSQNSTVSNAVAKPEDKCHEAADACAFAVQCCSGLYCDKKQYWLDGTCKSIPTGRCLKANEVCDYVGAPSCCKGSYCNAPLGACLDGKPCAPEGGDCSVDHDCCSCVSSGLPHPASCKAKKCVCSNQVTV